MELQETQRHQRTSISLEKLTCNVAQPLSVSPGSRHPFSEGYSCCRFLSCEKKGPPILSRPRNGASSMVLHQIAEGCTSSGLQSKTKRGLPPKRPAWNSNTLRPQLGDNHLFESILKGLKRATSSYASDNYWD